MNDIPLSSLDTDHQPALREREERIRKLTSGRLDVLVIGGGIHGSCVVQLLSRLGLRVGLLEMEDYASGTSSRSSKMAHGGLRYLEMLDFEQVFEGIKAREELFQRCPNLVRPYPFLIPVFRPDYLLKFKLHVGLWLYDLMLRTPAHRHGWISREKLTFESFNRQTSELMGCFRYVDGLMDDARLVIEMIVCAESFGAHCVNHAKVEHIHQDGGGDMVVSWSDTIKGASLESRARLVVNCAGPWAPFLRESTDTSAPLQVRYSRGSHLLFSVPWQDPALFLPLPERSRYYFVWPHPTGTMVGTTEREVFDLDVDPQISADEVEEILQRLAKDLPGSGLTRGSLHYAFAGVRTLPVRSSRRGVGRLSRKHVWSAKGGVLTLLGGKYTTFAWTATEGVALALKILGYRGMKVPNALSDLPSCLSDSERGSVLRELQDTHGRGGKGVERAVARLGRQVLRYIDRSDAWDEIASGVLNLELLHAVECEHAETLEDVLRRRLDLECTPSHGLELLPKIKQLLLTRYNAEQLEHESLDIVARLQSLHKLLGLPEPSNLSALA